MKMGPGMPRVNIERRAAQVARQCARIVLELRREGQHEAAARLEAAAIEAIEQMRSNNACGASCQGSAPRLATATKE
jgi:hypothetical protein